ncbi:hypothetical protein [Janthinobacterium lividum]|uniref:Uncharacterized protein n=1 Tax=Janthinobacterium lividum TaxID=29581 RepID=A0A1E8PNN0_9BURK|nr:hypothetical protein BA896_023295 [Janthinobacterium lividum]
MEEDNGTNAWLAARAGFALDTWIDRQLGGGQTLYNSSQTYGQDEFGNVYVLGRPNMPTRVTSTPQINPLFLLMLVGAVIFVASK